MLSPLAHTGKRCNMPIVAADAMHIDDKRLPSRTCLCKPAECQYWADTHDHAQQYCIVHRQEDMGADMDFSVSTCRYTDIATC